MTKKEPEKPGKLNLELSRALSAAMSEQTVLQKAQRRAEIREEEEKRRSRRGIKLGEIMKNPGKIVGYYFILIGVINLAGLIIEIFKVEQSTVSLSSIIILLIRVFLFISVGQGLLKNRHPARVTAIFISGLGFLAAIFSLVLLVLRAGGLITIAALNTLSPVTIYGSVALDLILGGGALVMLLHPNTRKHYRVPRFSKSNLVTVLKAASPGELMVAQSLLRSEDIPSFAGNEAVRGRFGGYGPPSGSRLPGGPLMLQVLTEHYARAREILLDMDVAIHPRKVRTEGEEVDEDAGELSPPGGNPQGEATGRKL